MQTRHWYAISFHWFIITRRYCADIFNQRDLIKVSVSGQTKRSSEYVVYDSLLDIQQALINICTILQENYGKKEEDKVNRVKEIYGEIGIPQTYRLYEEHTYELICNQIHQLSGGLPKQLFFGFLKTMTGR